MCIRDRQWDDPLLEPSAPRQTQDGPQFISAERTISFQSLCSRSPEDHRPQVPAKAHYSPKIFAACIDSSFRRRYPQAKIPDLVAHAIPRFLHPAPSFGSFLRSARPSPSQSAPCPRPVPWPVRQPRPAPARLPHPAHILPHPFMSTGFIVPTSFSRALASHAAPGRFRPQATSTARPLGGYRKP